ncbi:membrane protein, putative [Babesia bigemina]|uniref:Membrane protein, putative n=1 Tax=Babesia bigemina TaxID=5866 RepID=A0A061D5N7_BABBI|nr:membrane protein, putative [Babesia bigemina]CDR95863.1 membrane protein, putative [Babesia bigemina]|eukprot:XP_012768049.1 membrane protein, putative [Babesia bigemina]
MKAALVFLLAALAHAQPEMDTSAATIKLQAEKAFEHDIAEYTLKVLSCPSGTGLTITKAEWIATFSGQLDTDENTPVRLDRTSDVRKICRGLNNCILKPIAHLENVVDKIYHFFGVPFSNAKYTLNISGMCQSTARRPTGREMVASIDPSRDLVMGCDEGEVINLSFVRGAGLFHTWQYRHNYCNRSFMENAFYICQNQRSCTVDKSLYISDTVCNYQVIDAQYFCRPSYHNAYVDVIRKNGNDEIILTAEEDSFVTVKAPAESLLSVKSAVWDVVGKELEEDDTRRNRLDLLQFFCEGRSSCTFSPRRTSNGLLDLHLGGITSDNQKPFVFKAKFGIVKGTQNAADSNIKTIPCKHGQTVAMTCPSDRYIRVVSALWGGEVTDTASQPTNIFWEEKTVDGKLYRTTEIGAFLDKQVFNKSEFTFDPFAVVKEKRLLPNIEGIRENDHSLTVKYTCVDLASKPSVSDLGLVDIKSLTSDYDEEYSLSKEKVIPFGFKKNNQLIVMIEIQGTSEVQVGKFLSIQLPGGAEGNYVATLPQNNAAAEHKVEQPCDNAVINVLFAENKTIHVTTNLYRGTELVATLVDDLTSASEIKFEEEVKDIVHASGNVLGMRVFYKDFTPR